MANSSDGITGVTLADLLLASAPQLQLQNETATNYLEHAMGLPLAVLEAEPLKMTELSSQLDADLSSLCFRSYQSFLLAHDCTTALMHSFSSLDSSLDGFLAASQSLSHACKAFQHDIEPTMAIRNRISAVVDHVDSIEELLDLPRLVGTCVRSGNWQSAMDLARKVADFAKMVNVSATLSEHDKGKRVMRNVCEAVDAEMVNLKSRILESLRDRSLKLSGAVRAINMLRRANNDHGDGKESADDATFESTHQMMLLTLRWDCLQAQIDALTAATSFTTIEGASSDDRVRFIKRYIEIWREIVGDAVNMYVEIFLTDEVTTRDALAIKASRKPLVNFLHHALDTLLQMLEQHLPHVQTVSSIATLLTQLTYCATAFTRFGFDFRQHVTTLAHHCVRDLVIARFKEGLSELQAELRLLSNKRNTFESVLLAPESTAKVLALEIPPSSNGNLLSHQPPSQLTLFPPLARFVNAVAAALNELRLLPTPVIRSALKDALSHVLEEATASLLAVIEDAIPQPTTSDIDEEPVDRTARLKRENDRRSVCAAVVGFFGRGLLPWCERALRLGVYSDEHLTRTPDEDSRVKQAREKCENVLARVVST